VNDEWETPDWLFQALHAEFRFTIDAAASRTNHKLPRYWTARDDALQQSWAGERIWLNPPYSRGQIERWLAKVRKEVDAPSPAQLVVALLPADTSTQYFHRSIAQADEVRFLEGRVRFVGAPGAPKFGSLIAIWQGRLALPRRPHLCSWKVTA